MVSYSVNNFDASVTALQTHFDYQVIDTGRVSESLAETWGASAAAGSRYCVLGPESGKTFYIRFIEAPITAGYAPLRTLGWNATELLVKDVHALANELTHSEYTILGGPRDLLEDGTAIALQVRGPSDEIFYLTELNGKRFQTTCGVASTKVDRAFIVVLGASEHDAAMAYYRPACADITEVSRLGIRVLANAHGMEPMTSSFDIASAILGGQYRIEIDRYPPSAVVRPRLNQQLPPGMCMVSITAPSITGLGLPQIPNPQTGSRHTPYYGCKIAIAIGTANEWIELLERD